MEFLSFFIILIAGLFLSGIFSRLHVPWVVALLVTGFVLGPHGIAVVPAEDPTFLFLSEIGLIFLMFMAGLETKWSRIQGQLKPIAIVSVFTTIIPFIGGITLGTALGFSFFTALLLGIVFIASSIAVILPTLNAKNALGTPLGDIILGSTMVADIVGLVLLSIFLQSIHPSTALSLWVFYPLLLCVLILLKWGIPRIHDLFRHLSTQHAFEREIRLILMLIIGTVIIFELLGLHAVIAGFFAGFVLSESVKTDILKDKLHALAYGIFIPIFFVLVGVQADIGELFTDTRSLVVLGSILGSAFLLKFISGYVGGAVSGLRSSTERLALGFSQVPQLSTMFAAVFAGASLGLLDNTLVATFIAGSALSTVLAPLLLSIVYERIPVSPSERNNIL